MLLLEILLHQKPLHIYLKLVPMELKLVLVLAPFVQRVLLQALGTLNSQLL